MAHPLPNHHAFELKSDPRARSRAVAVGALGSGQNILVESPLAMAVHPSHKGRRCDACLREGELQKCSGCGVYYYCSRECQAMSWKQHHRRLCAFSKLYVKSEAYNDATEDARADVFLLAQLAAEHFYTVMTLDGAFANASVQTFWDLLTSPSTAVQNPIPALSFTSPSVLSAAAARFGNNNFVVHDARLVPYAHGVFALASRSFNHSCRPNAAAMFEETSSGVHMVVKLIENVGDGEEICISYTDPASPRLKRDAALEHAYGFSCQCLWCIQEASAAPPPLETPDHLRTRIESLVTVQLRNGQSTLEVVRDALQPLLPFVNGILLEHLPGWTAEFSTCSHDGPYDQALQRGNAVLGVYLLVYPGIHPLLELHCLELCKVAWNQFITSVGPGQADSLHVKEATSTYLRWAKQLGDRVAEGLEQSRASITAEYKMLESCLSEEVLPVSRVYSLSPDIKFIEYTGLVLR